MRDSRIRTYSELIQFDTILERFRYLALRSQVGCETFGFNRYINQRFYTSPQWRRLRHHVIARDNGCDLGVGGYDIHSRIIIHHMNPLDENDIIYGTRNALDPEFLISTTHETHNAIHFGDESLVKKPHTPRRPGDTKLW